MPRWTRYNYAYLDEQTKRMIRRAILKAVAIPGYQVPFGSREMPLPYGWGTGGIQVTAAIIGRDDTLKVIDQGADDTTNAVSIRRFFARVAGVATTERTDEATIIQTRHRIPETPLREGQILVFQVPLPEPLRMLEPRETETRTMHALAEYGLMRVSLYEDIARHGRIATTSDYPVMVNGRYLMSPSPIPKFDNPEARPQSGAAALRRGPREAHLRRAAVHAGASLDFEDHPFEIETWGECCALCGAQAQLPRRDDRRRRRRRLFVCSDTDYCQTRQRAQSTMKRAPLLLGARRHQVLRRPRRLPRRLVRPVPRRGAGHRRRIGLGQDHRARAASPAA